MEVARNLIMDDIPEDQNIFTFVETTPESR